MDTNAVMLMLAMACYCGGGITMPHLRRSVSLGSIFYENGAPTELGDSNSLITTQQKPNYTVN